MTTTLLATAPPASATGQPRVMVLICTRDRGASMEATIRSVLSNTYTNFDLLIVDQSDKQDTARAGARFCGDRRLRYVQTRSRGLSIARNIGLALSSSDLVLMTDDDCEVPPDWIAEMVAPFLRHPQVGVVFCDVVAGPHDPSAGLIPVSHSSHPRLIADLAQWQTCDGVNIGIGAGMAVRRSTAEALGGFNPAFGAGSRLQSGEDLEVTLRALSGGHQVYRLNHVGVVHHGFRTFEQNRRLMRSNMLGVGAAYSYLIRCGNWQVIRFYLAMLVAMVLVPIVESLLRLRVPPVLGRVIWLFRGTIAGLCLQPEPPSHCFTGAVQS
jgi:glycosyltransferase involved in cell wall biosynthesis